MITPPFKLSFREKFAFAFGGFGSVLYFQAFAIFLTYFYTDVFGLSAAVAGTMIGLSRSIDAFFDPIMGMLADRTKTRRGKFRPYLLWLCLPYALFGVLTFTVPGFSGAGKLLWAIVTYNGLMLLYTAINIPYNAMLGVITPNSVDRTTLASFMFGGCFAGALLTSATLLPLSRFLGQGSETRGWQLTFVVYGVLAIGAFLITYFNCHERVEPPPAQKTSVGRDLADLFTNGPWLILVGATLTFVFYVATRNSVIVHYFKYYVGPQTIALPEWLPKIGGTHEWQMEGLASAFSTCTQIGSVTGVILVPFYTRAVGRKAAFISMSLVSIACTSAFYFLQPDQLGLMFGIALLGAINSGPLAVLLWAMYADTADYGEWKHGRRATGLIFSASIFSHKQGWGIGAWVALGLMSSVGFKANVAQTPELLHGLVLLMSVIPAVLGLVSLMFMVFYPLNEKRVAAIGADLAVRRASAGGTQPGAVA